jgi:F1F0 ATPase subunit 2
VVTAKRPGLIFMGSFFFRISITLIGFYYISNGNWKKLVICMVGFIAARYVIMQVSMKYKGKQELLNEEAGYETES